MFLSVIAMKIRLFLFVIDSLAGFEREFRVVVVDKRLAREVGKRVVGELDIVVA